MTSTPPSTGPRKRSTAPAADNGQSFLQRWSRRKLARRTSEAESAVAGQELASDDLAGVDFDALDFNSDYTRFMSPQIPPALRSKALRKLWASNTALTQPDGLQDYAKDYTDAAMTLSAGVQSLYRVGRGFMTDEELGAWAKLALNSTPASSEAEPERESGAEPRDGDRPAPQGTADIGRADGPGAASGKPQSEVVSDRPAGDELKR
jgi:hypothetical protein